MPEENNIVTSVTFKPKHAVLSSKNHNFSRERRQFPSGGDTALWGTHSRPSPLSLDQNFSQALIDIPTVPDKVDIQRASLLIESVENPMMLHAE
jgi:hypothetical protein